MKKIDKKYIKGVIDLARLTFDFSRILRQTTMENGIDRERDTDHTIMVSLIACSLAKEFYPNLNIGKIARYALIHDLIEVYAGDSDTLFVKKEVLSKKEKLEKKSLNKIIKKFGKIFSWLPKEIISYEKLADKEARFVKTIDKLMPGITIYLNGGDKNFLKRINKDISALIQFNKDKSQKILLSYGKEFPEIIQMYDLLSNHNIRNVIKKIRNK